MLLMESCNKGISDNMKGLLIHRLWKLRKEELITVNRLSILSLL